MSSQASKQVCLLGLKREPADGGYVDHLHHIPSPTGRSERHQASNHER